MQKIYNKRFINSLYYDTKQRDMFYHSEEGVLPRKKIRIRWYNSEMNFKIEKKSQVLMEDIKQPITYR